MHNVIRTAGSHKQTLKNTVERRRSKDEHEEMNVQDLKIEKAITEILSSQLLAVLATERDGQPYSSLMAFANTADLRTVIVATGTATRKYMNLLKEARVSLLVDNRSNSSSDFHSAAAVTVIGRAEPVGQEERSQYEGIYLKKHPYLETFLQSPTTSLFKISACHYLIVNRFQNVMEYHLSNETDIFAAGM